VPRIAIIFVTLALAAVIAFLAFRESSNEARVIPTVETSTTPATPRATAIDAAPPSLPESRSAAVASRAPWAALQRRYRAGDYAWLIANARTAPEMGSLHFAFRAISHCMQVRSMPGVDERLAALKRMGAPNHEQQARALATLRAPCAELGDVMSLKIERGALELALATANDPVQALVREPERLIDRNVPASERERRIQELLALDDEAAAQAVRATVTTSGATFEGQPIAGEDELPYRLAWELVMCSRYGKCLGPDAMESHWECINQAACDYRTTAQRVEAFAGSRSRRVADFYARIERDLSARNFAAFGPP
jgi:hypothetical protein